MYIYYVYIYTPIMTIIQSFTIVFYTYELHTLVYIEKWNSCISIFLLFPHFYYMTNIQ